ncbi:MAG TPA: molecular chaperone HtpG [Hyphomicrobiaceae bacterium]|nr:molecular chaperone HtpG [Hyphomicrobiaceae bacterium]
MSGSDNLRAESHAFEADVSRLLDLMVHAVYSEREIFLRELISNASDACDKLRYEAIANPDLLSHDTRLAIRIAPDRSKGTLTVTDNGIGMDHRELIENLGTIAHSGTRAFLERIKDGAEGSALIGQFGVGFYSVFMVADRVEVVSRRAGSAETWTWVAEGPSGFTVRPAAPPHDSLGPHGTSVMLKLKSDAEAFLEEAEIERVVRTYSNHILFPVELAVTGAEPRQINTAGALWQRPKSEVKPEDYTQVYRTLTGHLDEPRLALHYKVEGRQTYAVLLFVPTRAPFDLFDPDRKGRVKLYVRRVYITDDADLLPGYLRFVRGVIDSEDVPLNISREMLQKNVQVSHIRKSVTGRVLAELESFAARDANAYEGLFETFGAVLKEGIYEDFERREQILKLARFRSTAGPGWRSLSDYLAHLRPNQTDIYYLVGESLERLKSSPQLEAARARGVEVLLLTDPIDHFWTALNLGFEGKPFKSLSKGEVDLSLVPPLDEAAGADGGDDGPEIRRLLDALKSALGEAVTDVRVSRRLVESPVCLVAPGQGPDLGLERLLQRQQRGIDVKPVLEINPRHPLVAAVIRKVGPADAEETRELASLLFDQAVILEGEVPPQPALFVARLNRILLKALSES